MTVAEAEQILQEALILKRQKESLAFNNFPSQDNFINSKSKLKAALCTRRAGKSFGVGRGLFLDCLRYPNTSQLYTALTRASAKAIMFKDVLKVINNKYKLGAEFKESELIVKMPNGSEIYLLGMDAKPAEAEKILGRKFKKAIVDEAGSFHQDLKSIIDKVIRPTLIDLDGTLELVGTPTNFIKSFFHDVTEGLVKGWDVYKWSANENPYMKAQWEKEIAELLLNNPQVEQTTAYKQMYKGEWIIETDKLVYKYDQIKNGHKPLTNSDYIYLLGVDLGWNDDTSFVVAAYSPFSKFLHYIYAEKQSNLLLNSHDTTEETLETKVEVLKRKYPISKFIIDGANKQAVETMKHRTRVPWEAADKKDKVNFIRILNNDLLNGTIAIDQTSCKPLIDEILSLIWDIDTITGERKENEGCANHCTDPFLYLHRHCYQYLSLAKELKLKPNTQEYMNKIEDEEDERHNASKGLNWFDKIY